MPAVLFVTRLPAPPAEGLFIDFRGATRDAEGRAGLREAALGPIYRRHGEAWQRAFVDWLGALNIANARLEWWAHTSTAKNLLSAPLGSRLFEILAALKFIEETAFDRLYLVGATAAQSSIIRSWLAENRSPVAVHGRPPAGEFGGAELALRLLYQALRTALAARWRSRFARGVADIHVLTYVDDKVVDGNDSFFGKLAALLAGRPRPVRCKFLAYVLAPYGRVLPRLARFREHDYWPLLLELTAADILWGLRKTLRARDAGEFDLSRRFQGLDVTPLMLEMFRWDLAKGGYLFNLLVYRAALRFARAMAPRRVLYPFENKSLEKTFLLGVREAAPDARVIGYQHTSITPRHATMLFAQGEARITPLPDLIVTAGDITRRYLERNGNYPAGIFATGCALRQTPGTREARAASPNGPTRILLALSSSRLELVRAIAFFRSLETLGASFELGVRPHPEFPLSMLPAASRAWIAAHATDLSGTSLAENIDWCTVVAYCSSTVGLEGMLRGKPAINIDLGEIVVPDPALETPPLWRRVASPEEFHAAIKDLDAIPRSRLEEDRRLTVELMQAYFRPATPERLEAFMQ